MPYKHKADAKRANALRRLKYRIEGKCRDCQNPVMPGRIRCLACHHKPYNQQRDKLEELRIRTAIRDIHWWVGASSMRDRKHNDNPSAALDWALIMHRCGD